MIESDAGAGEHLLHGSRDPISVSVGRDRDWTTIVQFGQRGTDVPSDGMRIAALGDLAVLDVFPIDDSSYRRRTFWPIAQDSTAKLCLSLSIPRETPSSTGI